MESSHLKLVALRALWERKRGGKAMPSRADFDVSEFKPWLGNLMLIDLVEADAGTIRLCGTNLLSRFGGDFTGCSVTALPNEVGASVCSSIDRVRRTKTVTSGTHMRVINGKRVTFEEIVLPLSDDGMQVKTLLFASYPVKSEQAL
ncbi:MAG: PAS domain-containing protein [Alphaproteobacteria bacterium]|nr:PAS domain-containing protein [Alphaproteobacteria bacterium]MDE2629835.1 PAS domain-containing protein [Alphaproteobacteria bacterium]